MARLRINRNVVCAKLYNIMVMTRSFHATAFRKNIVLYIFSVIKATIMFYVSMLNRHVGIAPLILMGTYFIIISNIHKCKY